MSYQDGLQTRYPLTVTIAKAGTDSTAGKVIGGQILGIQMPAGWNTADITIKASADGGTTYDTVKNAGSALTLTIDKSEYYGFTADELAQLKGVYDFKLIASNAQTTAARSIIVVVGQ
jgi:hypothetical protein